MHNLTFVRVFLRGEGAGKSQSGAKGKPHPLFPAANTCACARACVRARARVHNHIGTIWTQNLLNARDRKCLEYHAARCFSNFPVHTSHLENLVKLDLNQ